MFYIADEQVEKNFELKEFIEWPKIALHNKYKLENIRCYNESEEVRNNIRKIAAILQWIRDKVNDRFKQFNGKIGLKITSGFRNVQWEKFRGRNGMSRHVIGDAVDYIVVGVGHLINEVMSYIYNELLFDWIGGLACLIIDNVYQFIHIDMGSKRRWTY